MKKEKMIGEEDTKEENKERFARDKSHPPQKAAREKCLLSGLDNQSEMISRQIHKKEVATRARSTERAKRRDVQP